MMTPEAARYALQFMARVQLQGQEVPAFNIVMAALSESLEGQERVEPEQDGEPA